MPRPELRKWKLRVHNHNLAMKILGIVALSLPMFTGCTIIEPSAWPAGTRQIVLTFDDGPVPDSEISHQILDVIERHEVPATFCYVGVNIERHPGAVRRAWEAGHELAVHTYSHTPGTLISGSKLEAEIDATLEAMRQATGDPSLQTRVFRPPWGLLTPAVRSVLGQRNLQTAHITFFAFDAHSGPDKADRVMRDIRRGIEKYEGGAIVLHEMAYFHHARRMAHPDKSWLPEALETFIAWARQEGYQFVSYRDQASSSRLADTKNGD